MTQPAELAGRPNAEPTPFDDAGLYDLLFGDFDYGIAFYLERARAAAGPVLEVACGTGRVLLALLQAGIDADGVDLFAPMLERARVKAEALGFQPGLFRAPMRDFRLPRRYALVYIAFNSFVHNLTQEDQIATLNTCREHLLPGGRLVFDLFYPGSDYLTGEQGIPILEHEVTDPATGHRFQIYDTRNLEPVEQIQRSENEVRELDADGSVVRIYPSRTATRWIFKPEMELLLRLAGFTRWTIRSFDGQPLAGRTEPAVVTAWQD
jgi:SAM-dependent methyltransferase